MCFISIIIPTFNRLELLSRELDSVYRQSFSDFEVIVVDDGSGDGTAEMISTKFPQVHYHYQDNAGVSSARNKGLLNAKADWIAFLDSDDEWLPEKLLQQVQLIEQNPGAKICHTEEIWIRNGTRVNQMKKHRKAGGWIFQQCLPLCAMSPSSIMIHRTVFEDVGVFDIELPACEDYDLWLRIAAKYPVLYIEQPLIKKYGGHEDQLSQKYWGMDRYRIKALEKIIKQNELNEEHREWAITMLLKKARIFQQGALKRGKNDAAEAYQRIIDIYQSA